MDQYIQASRFISIETALGKYKLLATAFAGVELISDPLH